MSSCLWARTLKGQLEATVVDGSGEYAPKDGIHFFFANETNSGKCGVSIESVTEDHVGKWACALVADVGEVLTGEVELYSGTYHCIILLVACNKFVRPKAKPALINGNFVSTNFLYQIEPEPVVYFTTNVV